MKTGKSTLLGIVRMAGTLALHSPLRRFWLIKKVHRFIFLHFGPSQGVPVKVQGQTMYLDPTDISVSRALFIDGIYSPAMTSMFREVLKPGMVVCDIGAHIGYFTLLSASIVGDKGKVFAFEPAPQNYALLEKNIAANGYSNVIAVPKAVSDRSGSTSLYLSPIGFTGDQRIYATSQPRESTLVEVTTLDEFLSSYNYHVDFIKIDIQGAETAALHGARNTITKNEGLRMIVELWRGALAEAGSSADELLNLLWQMHFKLYMILDYPNIKREILPFDFSIMANIKRADLLCEKG